MANIITKEIYLKKYAPKGTKAQDILFFKGAKNAYIAKIKTPKGPLMDICSQANWERKGVPFVEFFTPRDTGKKVCYRRGMSGAYDYIWKNFSLHISMAGKADGILPWNVGEKIIYEWAEDNGSTGLINPSHRVCSR